MSPSQLRRQVSGGEGGRVRSGQIVRSSDHETIYFVSAEIDGPGLEDTGDVGTWATENRFGGGAEESRACVAAAG